MTANWSLYTARRYHRSFPSDWLGNLASSSTRSSWTSADVGSDGALMSMYNRRSFGNKNSKWQEKFQTCFGEIVGELSGKIL